MANVQSSLGSLNVFEVLNKIGIGLVLLEVSVEVDKILSGYTD